MKRCHFLALAFMFLAAAEGAAQISELLPWSFPSKPDNTVAVDLSPMIFSLYNAAAGLSFNDGAIVVSPGTFGGGVHYERVVNSKLSLAGRFAYLGFGITVHSTDADVAMEVAMNSISLEAHARFYPWGGLFFLDGLAGYGNILLSVTYRKNGGEPVGGDSDDAHYLKLGAKLGWKVDFGEPDGFVLEASLGACAALGTKNPSVGEVEGIVVTNLQEFLDMAASYIFVGGPRLTLCAGWAF